MKSLIVAVGFSISLFCGPSLFASTAADSRVRALPTSVRDAGVYHLASGTWHRPAQAALGVDVIYNNTCDEQYYQPFDADQAYTDEGRVPSPTSPNNLTSRAGCAVQYAISGFEIAYCTDLPSETIVVEFFDVCAGCVPPTGTPRASFVLSGMPGTATPGVVQCWSAIIDLDASPGVPFVLQADGDGIYQPSEPYRNSFAWRLRFPSSQGSSGPVIAGGGFGACTVFDGTIWDPNGQDFDERGSGMGAHNFWVIENPTSWECRCCSGHPELNFHLRLFSSACPIGGPGISFCAGDGSASPCPCGNQGQAFNGCANSVNANGARLTAVGTPSLGGDTLQLRGSSMPDASALYFQGTLRTNLGLGTAFGDGLRCAGGTVIRLGTVTNVAGQSVYPGPGQPPIHVQGQVPVPGTRVYQTWYRNAATFCTPATFNLSNGYELSWAP